MNPLEVAREIFAGRSGVRWEEGEPGDAFLTIGDREDTSRWAIWKYLDGEMLAEARECGYTVEKYPNVVSMILTGDALNPPHTAKTDDEDLPYAMGDPRRAGLTNREWFYLGKL